jgi:hypothetical protein
LSGKKPPVNLVRSVRDRLLALRRTTGEEANLRVVNALKHTFDRGVPVLCLFADDQHRRHLESALPGLLPVESTARARFSVQSLEGADHNFVMPGCPERLAEALLAWLSSPEQPWAKPTC